jgi:hypothetical protein
MARQNINLGTNANDGTGDKLRDAMTKVNDNLIELYSRTGGDATQTGTSIGVSGNILGIGGDMTITTNNVGNLTIAATTYITKDSFLSGNIRINTQEVDTNNRFLMEGNLRVKGSATIGQDSNVDSLILNSTVYNSIIPTFDNTFDIGTPSLKYRNMYVGGTINSANIYTANANINGGKINSTIIGDATPAEGRFSTLRSEGDSFLGDLLIRDNQISTGAVNGTIEFRPNGTGNVYVSTKLIVGSGSTPMVNPVLQATGNADNFSQIGVQNTNNGKFACSDIVVFTNDGSDFFNFADIGQNNSGWDGSLQYIYFDDGTDASTWQIGDMVVQYDINDGSSILARGEIDEKVNNPANPAEIRIRVCKIFEGTTGIFEQGSISGDVYNESDWSNATPKDHLLETFTSTGVAVYNIGTHSLNDSTAKAAFAPTIALASDSIEVKVNGILQAPGEDYTVQFDKIKFYNVPPAGQTITIRQYPDANYPFTVGQSGDSYVYNNGSKLTIGTMTGHDVLFHVNGIRYTAEAGRIKGHTKNWIIGSGVTDKYGFTDTGEKLQVHGVIRTSDHVKGGLTEGNIDTDFILNPVKTIYSYTPTVSDINIYLSSDSGDAAGRVIIFNNRSSVYSYNLIDQDTSTLIASIDPNTAHSLACDSNGWFLVSTI